MINSWELEGLENQALFHDLAIGYIDGSISLTRDMLANSFEDSFSHSRVILSLAYHGVELFLKGAICGKTSTPEIMGCHDLKKLKKEYDRIFPSSEFELQIPFGYQYIGYDAKNIEELVKNEPPQDQTFRYYTNKKGNVWKGIRSEDGITAFLAESFLTTIQELRQRVFDLGEMLHKDK
jgi:hypothetical protein